MPKIVIEMDMPKSCDECPLFDDRWDYPTCYVNQLSSGYNFPIRDKRMDFCPIKCDIDVIKAEIQDGLDACKNIIDNVEKGVYPKIYSNDEMIGRKITYEHCLKIIDKYTERSKDAKDSN